MPAAVKQRTSLVVGYKSSKRGDHFLLRAAGLAKSLNAQMAVVVPFVIPADGPGCCGIRGRAWEDMLRRVADEDAEQALGVLENAGVPHSVGVVEGLSVSEIIEATVIEGGCELVLPESPAGTVYSGSDLRRLRRLAPGGVRDLSATST